MILTQLPENKFTANKLTIGKNYDVIKTVGKCFIILLDDVSEEAYVLSSRFTSAAN